jgi:hypothetical protein
MAHRHDHLNYLELIYYGLDNQNGIRYSNYNKSAERNADREIRVCPKCDKAYEIYSTGRIGRAGKRKYNQFNYKDFPKYGKEKEKCAICRKLDGEKVFFTWDRGSRTSIPIGRFCAGYKKENVRIRKKSKRLRGVGIKSINK